MQATTEQLIDIDRPGSIGKRYRRQDEIGTPFCITVDFDSLSSSDAAATGAEPTVTVRLRDSMAQTRVPLGDLARFISSTGLD